jgi:hypothetical protein
VVTVLEFGEVLTSHPGQDTAYLDYSVLVVMPGQCSIMARPIPSKSFTIRHSSVILQSYAIQCTKTRPIKTILVVFVDHCPIIRFDPM